MIQQPYRYATIPNAKARLTTLLRRLRLQPQDPSQTVARWIAEKRRYYMPPLITADGTEVFFKGRLQAAPELAVGLENEIRMQAALKRIGTAARHLFRVPLLLRDGSAAGGLRWYTREYFHGGFAGVMDRDLGYRAAFLQRVGPERMFRTIMTIQRLTARLTKTTNPPVHGAYWYGVDFAFYHRFFRSKLPYRTLAGAALPAIAQLLAQNKTILNHAANVASHGDLYPNNLLVTPRGSLAVLDWELFNLNTPVFDLSFVELLAWRNPRWQKRLARLSSRSSFRALLPLRRLAVATLCLRFLRHCLVLEHPDYHQVLRKSGFSNSMIAEGEHNGRRALPRFRAALTAAVRSRAAAGDEEPR